MRAGCSSFCWPFISYHAMRCRYIALLGSDAPLAKLVLRPCYLTHSLYCGPLPYIEATRVLHVCGQPVACLQDGRPAAGSQHSSQHILPQHMQVERPPPRAAPICIDVRTSVRSTFAARRVLAPLRRRRPHRPATVDCALCFFFSVCLGFLIQHQKIPNHENGAARLCAAVCSPNL